MYNNNILAHKIGPLENYTEKVIFFRTAFDRPTTPPANFCNGSAVTAVTSRGGSTEAQIPRGYVSIEKPEPARPWREGPTFFHFW